jgi:hypothetical protein
VSSHIPTEQQVQRFLSNDANGVMCVRAEDYDKLLNENAGALGKHALRCALQRYGKHEYSCEVTARGNANGATCSCGWERMSLAMWVGVEGEKPGDREALTALKETPHG